MGVVFYRRGNCCTSKDYLMELENCSAALDNYFKALKVAKKQFGLDHEYSKTICENICITYNCIGNEVYLEDFYPQAEKVFVKTIKVVEDIVGSEHHTTAIAYQGLANVYNAAYDDKKYVVALEKFAIALLASEGPCNMVIWAYNNLSELSTDLTTKQNFLQKALEISNVLENRD